MARERSKRPAKPSLNEFADLSGLSSRLAHPWADPRPADGPPRRDCTRDPADMQREVQWSRSIQLRT